MCVSRIVQQFSPSGQNCMTRHDSWILQRSILFFIVNFLVGPNNLFVLLKFDVKTFFLFTPSYSSVFPIMFKVFKKYIPSFFIFCSDLKDGTQPCKCTFSLIYLWSIASFYLNKNHKSRHILHTGARGFKIFVIVL